MGSVACATLTTPAVNGIHAEEGEKAPPVWRPAASVLRDLLADKSRTLVCPGVYDGLTARIALRAGFDCLYMTGAGSTASMLGMPDLAIISLNEMHDNARMIAGLASSDPQRVVPVIADADTGFGSPLNVSRTVAAYITSNIAALHIEDQTQTKRCGHLGGKQLVSADEFVTRIKAASLTRRKMGRDIVIIARTDCLQKMGFDEAISRLKRAVEAGADVAFIEGIPDKETGTKMCKALSPTPVLCNIVTGGLTPAFSQDEAQEMGVRVVIHTAFAMSPVYRAVTEAANYLLKTGKAQQVEGNGSFRDIFSVCGLEDCVELDKVAGGEMLDGNL